MGRYIACQNGRHALPPKLSVQLVLGEVKSIFRAVNSLGSGPISRDAALILEIGRF